jgi:hypothetical protein
VVPVLRSVTDAFRERARELVELPDGEGVEVELAENQRWRAFSLYLGNLRSRFSYNVDRPLPAAEIAHLVAHEAYPGHHTEDAVKDVAMVREGGRVELTVGLAVGVQPVVAEGVAELGAELMATEECHALVAEVLERHGVSYEAAVGLRVASAQRGLSGVTGNLVLLHAEGTSRDELVDYGCEWSLQPRDRVAKKVDDLANRPFLGYAFCYTEGLRLCRGFVGSDPARYRRLVAEQLALPDLRTVGAEAAVNRGEA